jgi:hypothetical protein
MQFAGGEEMHRSFAPLRTTGGEDARVERTLLSAAFAVGVVPGVTEIPVSNLSFQKLSLVIPHEVRNPLFARISLRPVALRGKAPFGEKRESSPTSTQIGKTVSGARESGRARLQLVACPERAKRVEGRRQAPSTPTRFVFRFALRSRRIPTVYNRQT